MIRFKLLDKDIQGATGPSDNNRGLAQPIRDMLKENYPEIKAEHIIYIYTYTVSEGLEAFKKP